MLGTSPQGPQKMQYVILFGTLLIICLGLLGASLPNKVAFAHSFSQTLEAEKGHRQPVAPSSFKNSDHPAARRSLYQSYSDALQSGHDGVSCAAGKNLR